MAVYKVPQDVEAEDHLIGPFSFRQFIYLIIVAIAIFIAWLLGQVFIGLAIIPLPIILFFGVLALPLRKDQPMETYVVAVVRFFLKPHVRKWDPDGQMSLVTVNAPKVTDIQLTKDFGSNEAERRLSYLAQIVDTRGWASRGVSVAPTSLTDTVAAEAQSAEDMLGDNTSVAQSLTQLITQHDVKRKQQAVSQFQQAIQETSQPAPQPVAPSDGYMQATPQNSDPSIASQDLADPVLTAPSAPVDAADLDYNPYPSSMRQHVIVPQSEQERITAKQPMQPTLPASKPHFSMANPFQKPASAQKAQKQAVTPAVSPDIIRLANNNDLSISAIANEAHRLESKDGEEVVISLR